MARTKSSTLYLKVSCSLLLNLIGQRVNLEPIQPRYKLKICIITDNILFSSSTLHYLICGTFWPILWVHHEEHVWEACAKISPICVVVSENHVILLLIILEKGGGYLEDFGVYTSIHLGQYSLTMASPGTSDRPMGNMG